MLPSEAAARQLIATWRDRAPSVVSDYLKTFPAEGSLVLRDLEAYAGIWRPGPKEDHELQRMEGRREMFLWIRAMLSLTPADIEKLIGEQDDTR